MEPDAASESAAEISLRQELDALRLQLTTTSAAVAHGTATDGLANVPGEVPPIRSNLQSTQGMQAAKETLLAETGAQAVAVSSKGAAAGAKVGAFGMGGIGKTIMAAWICRDEDIRKHFDVILWITLSQTPNVPKLMSLMMLQATGSEFPSGLETPPEEAKELLTQALRGKKSLLVCAQSQINSCCFHPVSHSSIHS